jgi:hypothetical protein
VHLGATPSRPLSHYPPHRTIEAPSRPPPSVVEAAFPSSATSGHRRAPPSAQQPPVELTAAPRTLSRCPPPLLRPALAGSPPPTCFATMSPPRLAPLAPMPQIRPSPLGLAPWHLLSRPLTAGWLDSIGEPHAGGEWGELPCFISGRKDQVGQAAFTGLAKCHSGCSPLQQLPFPFIRQIIQINFQICFKF